MPGSRSPRAGDVVVWDTEQPGLFLRKFASGKAVYGVRYYVAGKPRQKHLREIVAGLKGLAAARKEAGDVRAKARLGTDVVAEVRAKTEAAKRIATTLGDVAKVYLQARKRELRHRSYLEIERHINTHWEDLHGTPIEDITRADVVAMIDGLAASSGKVAADRARAAISTHCPSGTTRTAQASWIMPSRTRALPERANPLSRRFAPLSSGER